MGKQTITHSCGHDTEVQMSGRHTDRDRKAATLAKHPCKACQDAAGLAAAEQIENSLGLAALTGSEKQVTWARQIRMGKTTEEVGMRDVAVHMRGLQAEQLPLLGIKSMADFPALMATGRMEVLNTQSAAWWIDNRDHSMGYLVAQHFIAKLA